MTSIGIVGSGIAGLHLGLLLQQRCVPVTLYSDRSPQELRAGRLPNSVARFDHTRDRERALGVDHWDFPDYGMVCAHFRINGPPGAPPLAFCGRVARPASFVDMRLYLPALLEDLAARGGAVVVGAVAAEDLGRLAGEHDLVVVASGRASLTELFPRLPEHSPYDRPQRLLCAGTFRGIGLPEPLGLAFTIAPGHGEVFQAPFYSAAGRVSSLLVEAIPGGELEPVTRTRYDDDPRRFEALVLDALRAHAPGVYERVDHQAFGLTGPLDVLQGAVRPTVRRGHTPLGGGRYAVALGDVHVLNDPVLGQGANTASHAAWALGEEILAALGSGRPFDQTFCERVEQRIWDYARPVTAWTNAALQPPPPHAVAVFAAAAEDQAIADELVDNFNAPERNWAIFGSPAGAAAFLRRFGRQISAAAPG